MSKNSNFAKNTFILSIGTFIPKFAQFITLPLLTGMLSKQEYGTYDLITVLVSLFLPTLTLQIKSTAFRFLLEVREDKEKQNKIITNIMAVTVPVSVISLLILFIVLPGTSALIKLWICGYYFFDILVNTVRQISRGLGNNLDYSISSIISAFGKMIFAVIFVLGLKWGLLGATIALCFSSMFSFIFLSFRLHIFKRIDVKLIEKQTIKELLAYSWPMVPNDTSLWVMNMSDRLIITIFRGVTVNAVYAVATKIPLLINLAQNALTLAWQETASITAKEKDAAQYYTDMFKVMLSLQAGVYSMVVAASPILFKIFIKGDYDSAFYQIPILCYSQFFLAMSVYIGGIYVAYKSTRSVGITSLCAAVVNIVVHLSLIQFIGIYAASISTLASYIALFAFRAINVRKLTAIRYNFKQIAILNVLMIVEAVLCYQRNIICYIINFVIVLVVIFVFNQSLVKGFFNIVRKKIR